MNGKIFKLKGKVQHYAWGGYDFLPSLLGFKNDEHKPCAEYWMGAHPSASSELVTVNGNISLHALIQRDASSVITENVFRQFGELPYLFKILDVKDMLSIQVHPSKIEAEKGFDAEEAAGIPINAPHRNYKDKNHKPEVMVALSEFWLLHGFKMPEELERTLQEVYEFNILLPLFRKEGYKSLYQFVMEMAQTDVDRMLTPLVKREIRKKQAGEVTKEHPAWWVGKLFEGKESFDNIDRGIFSIYFFNIVKVNRGEAVFQGAGVPHAYLEGQNVELMANSDNVLRGGLTPKHIDVPELLKHTLFKGIVPNVMKGNTFRTMETNYPCPVPDFGITKIELNGPDMYTAISASLEIIIAVEGGCVINGSNHTNIVLKQGEAVAVMPGEEYSMESSGHCLLFKAFVPA
ncbi:MAG: mannose-6-phosphate isomerase, class I [Bacteroidota bacterium]|nr:mannose-6-phosphate isomerase, class I [Bacteroidota bacterium]